jgi:hypothetical protein
MATTLRRDVWCLLFVLIRHGEECHLCYTATEKKSLGFAANRSGRARKQIGGKTSDDADASRARGPAGARGRMSGSDSPSRRNAGAGRACMPERGSPRADPCRLSGGDVAASALAPRSGPLRALRQDPGPASRAYPCMCLYVRGIHARPRCRRHRRVGAPATAPTGPSPSWRACYFWARRTASASGSFTASE